MPAEIITTRDDGKTAYDVVGPSQMTTREIYNQTEAEDYLLLVVCDTTDKSSRVFLFPQPETMRNVKEVSTAEMVETCSQHPPSADISHEGALHVSTLDRDRNPVAFTIGHLFHMGEN